jgi:hypothetical protein
MFFNPKRQVRDPFEDERKNNKLHSTEKNGLKKNSGREEIEVIEK